MKLGEALLGVSRRESAAAEDDHSAESRRVKTKDRARDRVERIKKQAQRGDRHVMPLHGVRAQVALRALHDTAPRQAAAPKLRGTR